MSNATGPPADGGDSATSNHPPTASAAAATKKRKRQLPQQQEEKEDEDLPREELEAALRYVATVGRSAADGYYRRQRAQQQEQYRISATATAATKFVHPRDAREYGLGGDCGGEHVSGSCPATVTAETGTAMRTAASQPWSALSSAKRRRIEMEEDNGLDDEVDADWNREYRDQFCHPIQFSVDRLSSSLERPPLPLPEGVVQNSAVPVSAVPFGEDGTRAVLLSCWERAVHASATAIPISVVPTAAATATTTVATDGDNSSNTKRSTTTSELESKCRAMKIELPSRSPYKCPHCGVQYDRSNSGDKDYDSSDDERNSKDIVDNDSLLLLRRHFYGPETAGGEGGPGNCSRNMIQKRRLQLIDQVLGTTVRTQLNRLVDWVTGPNAVAPAVNRDTGEDGQDFVLDWHYVLRRLSDRAAAIAYRQQWAHFSRTYGRAPPGLPPPPSDVTDSDEDHNSVANTSMLLESVPQRLYERYGNPPRANPLPAPPGQYGGNGSSMIIEEANA